MNKIFSLEKFAQLSCRLVYLIDERGREALEAFKQEEFNRILGGVN